MPTDSIQNATHSFQSDAYLTIRHKTVHYFIFKVSKIDLYLAARVRWLGVRYTEKLSEESEFERVNEQRLPCEASWVLLVRLFKKKVGALNSEAAGQIAITSATYVTKHTQLFAY